MRTLVVILGPTAVGKTELSLSLAKLLCCDIISADSRQIYRHIDIGTAKPTEEERSLVPHRFVDMLELEDYYSAAQYESDVTEHLEKWFCDHDYALMAGGSMMYTDAVTKGIDSIPTIDDATRDLMKHKLETDGLDTLCAELRLLDPEYYRQVDLKNHKRVVHALEVCYMTGRPYSSYRTNSVKQRPFRIVKIGLKRERQDLFARINARVDKMMEQGFMREAEGLYRRYADAPDGFPNSLNTVGYKELFNVLEGKWELKMAVERIKKNTRVYAKKQMTWYAHDSEICWLDANDPNLLLRALECVKKQEII